MRTEGQIEHFLSQKGINQIRFDVFVVISSKIKKKETLNCLNLFMVDCRHVLVFRFSTFLSIWP